MPEKPKPVNLENIKPPEENAAQFPHQDLNNMPHKIVIQLIGNQDISFEVGNGEQAAKFLDSITAICEKKSPIARLGIGAEVYAIPTEKILYAKLSRPNAGFTGAR